MKSIKLTNDLRGKIVESIIDAYRTNFFADLPFKRESEVNEKIQRIEQEIMISLWKRAYGQYEEALASIPADMRVSSSFTVSTLNGGCGRYKSNTLPLHMTGKKCGVDLILTEEEWDEAFAEQIRITKILIDFYEGLAQLKNEVSPILNSVNTTKQLVELWPAAQDYIPANIADPSAIKLPAISISRLEERIAANRV